MSGWTGGQGQGVALPGGCSDSSGTGRRPGVLWAPGHVLATSTETSTGWWPCLHRGPPAGWLGPPSAFPGEAGSLSFPRPAKSQLLPVPAGRGVRGQRRKTGRTWNSRGPTGPLANKCEGQPTTRWGAGDCEAQWGTAWGTVSQLEHRAGEVARTDPHRAQGTGRPLPRDPGHLCSCEVAFARSHLLQEHVGFSQSLFKKPSHVRRALLCGP